jgi:hypothetical protein
MALYFERPRDQTYDRQVAFHSLWWLLPATMGPPSKSSPQIRNQNGKEAADPPQRRGLSRNAVFLRGMLTEQDYLVETGKKTSSRTPEVIVAKQTVQILILQGVRDLRGRMGWGTRTWWIWNEVQGDLLWFRCRRPIHVNHFQ